MDIIKAQRSRVYLAGCAFVYISGICSIVAFTSPYWCQFDKTKYMQIHRSANATKNRFINIGLWQVCFKNYKHIDNRKKLYTGCYYTYSDDIVFLKDWIKPYWFVTVQVLVSLELVMILIYLIVITVSVFSFLKHNRFFMSGIGIYSTVLGFVMLAAFLIFAANAHSREWMPHADENSYSWSYWAQIVATILTLFSAIAFFSEARSLIQRYDRQRQEKLDLNSTLDGENEESESAMKHTDPPAD